MSPPGDTSVFGAAWAEVGVPKMWVRPAATAAPSPLSATFLQGRGRLPLLPPLRQGTCSSCPGAQDATQAECTRIQPCRPGQATWGHSLSCLGPEGSKFPIHLRLQRLPSLSSFSQAERVPSLCKDYLLAPAWLGLDTQLPPFHRARPSRLGENEPLCEPAGRPPGVVHWHPCEPGRPCPASGSPVRWLTPGLWGCPT